MRKTINGIQVPQRADFVGSFLRPADLSTAIGTSVSPNW